MIKHIFYLIAVVVGLIFARTVAYSQATLDERLQQHVYTLASDSLMGRKAGSEHARKAADYIAAQWKEIGVTPLTGESYFIPVKIYYCNLAAIIEGNDPIMKNEYIVVGAHYDHLGAKTSMRGDTVIYNGADDNASGVATVIELARNLKAIQSTLRRSVIVIAFDAEEIGLFGSNDFSSNPPFPVEKIRLMFSVDMVGWHKTSGYVEDTGAGTIKEGERLLLDNSLIPDGLHVKTKKFEKSMFTGTDTHGFANKGIPTFAVTTGLKSPYHKPGDMAHLIDYEGMALITEHLTHVVQAVSKDDSFQASGKIASKHQTAKKVVFGISVNSGSNYHYYKGGEMNGKPANAAGIGLNGQVNMKFFAIRPEVYYDYVSARHPDGKITTQSITVPLNLLLQTPPSSMSGAAIFAGPYYCYRLDGKQGGAQLDFENMFHREEIGLNMGFEMRVVKIRVGYTFRNALTNFSQTKNADGAHIRNRASYFTLSYTF
jgi:hypothetical protein